MTGNEAAALRAFCLAALHDPRGPGSEAVALLFLGRRALTEAESWARLSLTGEPERRTTQELLGDILSQKGDNQGALKVWLATLKLSPDAADKLRAVSRYQTKEAVMVHRKGDRLRAERLLRRAAFLDPANLDAVAELVRLYRELSEEKVAEAWLARGLAQEPAHPVLLSLQGKVPAP